MLKVNGQHGPYIMKPPASNRNSVNSNGRGGVDGAALTGADVGGFDGENSRCCRLSPVSSTGSRPESESPAPSLSRPRTLAQRVIGTLRCRARTRWVLSSVDGVMVQRRDNMAALTLAGGQLKLIGEAECQISECNDDVSPEILVIIRCFR